MSSGQGELVTETFDYDGGRQVTAYLPSDPPEAVVFAGDGQLISQWGEFVAAAGAPSTMIVGVHRLADETLRLHEYSPGFDPKRFAAHETFLVEDVREWAQIAFRRRADQRTHRGVRRLGGWRTGARHRASASGCLRCGILRLSRCGLPAA